MTMFVLGSSKSCLPKNNLYPLKIKGGLGFPNVSTYYQTAHLAQIPTYHATYEITYLGSSGIYRLWSII